MFTRKPASKTELEEVIDHLLATMRNTTPDTKESAAAAEQVAKLYKLKAEDKPKRVSPDTWLVAATNLAGIVLVLQNERLHVVTSKAFGFIQKLR